MMTVGDLRRELESYDDDVEVRIMTQESWPFENDVYGLFDPSTQSCTECSANAGEDVPWHDPDNDLFDHESEAYKPADRETDQVVYLTEGTQRAYGTKAAWRG